MRFILNVLFVLIFSVTKGFGFITMPDSASEKFTSADSVRGRISPERAWWNVLRYDLTVKPDYKSKTISGKNIIGFEVLKEKHPLILQIDLQEPMKIDSVILNSETSLYFKQFGNAWYVAFPPEEDRNENSLQIYFHGEPKEARFPPWDGGWVWSKDSLGNPWMSAACQGLGASSWYPCKDHQSDEPDKGASLTMIVASDLTGVSNGRLKSKNNNEDGTVSYKWEVVSPINNYNIIPYIGKYANYRDSYDGENGLLEIELWVLEYHFDRASGYLIPEIKKMFKALEHWFGPYPFYEDSYKIVEAPYAGMEHQSAVAYGNKFGPGFWGRDRSKTGYGMKFDYMIVHESAHEWFGNNITTNDIADMWVHEAFADYSEALFLDYWYGKDAADEYNHGLRNTITNTSNIIGSYNVNNEGSSDMYSKGSNMLNSIRHSMDDDEKFREIIRGLTKTFYHKTVDTKDIENYISDNSGYDYGKVLDQYLRTTQIPKFEFYFSKDREKIFYRYTDCIDGFNLPVALDSGGVKIKIYPEKEKWNSSEITSAQAALFTPEIIERMYYVNVSEVKK